MFQESPGCPTGWIVQSGRCYKFSTDEKNWEEAEEHCKINGVRMKIFLLLVLNIHQGSLAFRWQSKGARPNIPEYK